MDEAQAKQILDKIIGQIFGYQNPLSLEQFTQKFAFDVRLPQKVFDSTDNSETWAQSTNPTKFIKMDTARERYTKKELEPKQPINSLQDLLARWDTINLTSTERQIDSVNIAQCDNIYHSENIFHSMDVSYSKNIIFSDGVHESDYVAASQRSNKSSFCIRLEDSTECSNSFGISWCGKVTNCLFLHDCSDVQDSMFCTNIQGKRFCIANMQFEEAEYNQLRQQVVQWILSPAS